MIIAPGVGLLSEIKFVPVKRIINYDMPPFCMLFLFFFPVRKERVKEEFQNLYEFIKKKHF